MATTTEQEQRNNSNNNRAITAAEAAAEAQQQHAENSADMRASAAGRTETERGVQTYEAEAQAEADQKM